MNRLLALSAIWCGGLLSTAPFAAAQKTSDGDYFPAKQGDTWMLRVKAPNKQIDGVVTVSKVEKQGQATLVTRETRANGELVYSEVYRVTPQGVWQIGAQKGTHFDPPLPILRYPARSGSKWTWQGTMISQAGQFPMTAAVSLSGTSSLTTAAGTFSAVKVQMVQSMSAGGQKAQLNVIYYFAPGVGIVKTETGAPLATTTTVQSYKVK